jgi:hypothetical protein
MKFKWTLTSDDIHYQMEHVLFVFISALIGGGIMMVTIALTMASRNFILGYIGGVASTAVIWMFWRKEEQATMAWKLGYTASYCIGCLVMIYVNIRTYGFP